MIESREEIKDILAECFNSMEKFCKVFFPDVFDRPFSAGHRQIFTVLDALNSGSGAYQKAAIAAPRGFGKSSILRAFQARHILYQTKSYIIPISATADSAIEQSENLKQELLANELVQKLFGDFRSKQDFTKLAWVTPSGIKVMPRGAGQQVRGRLYKSHRPDLYVIDDLEDDEAVESEDRRRKLKQWFFSSVLNSVDRGSKEWRVIFIGTILHEDSLLSNLLNKKESPDWHSVRLELCDNDYVSRWPEFISTEEIKELADGFRQRDMLDVFYREYRNIPIALEQQGFKDKYFKYYTETEEELNRNSNVETVILADPARTHGTGSANTAVVGIGVDTVGDRLYIRDVVEGQFSPDELIDEMFSMALRLCAIVLAPEVTGLHEYITYPINNKMIELGVFYHLVEVKPRQGKTGSKRSAGMIPMYRTGKVYHNKNCCGGLEKYLLQWPRPTKWDVIDALSGIIYTLDEGERYFHGTDDSNDIEAEYEELEETYEDDVLELDWQVI